MKKYCKLFILAAALMGGLSLNSCKKINGSLMMKSKTKDIARSCIKTIWTTPILIKMRRSAWKNWRSKRELHYDISD